MLTFVIAGLLPLLTTMRAADLPPDLARAVSAYDRAQVSNDVRALAQLVTDDYVLVNSDGTVENKQQFLADFLLPGFRIEPYEIEAPVQKVLATPRCSAAWCTYAGRRTASVRLATCGWSTSGQGSMERGG